VRQYGAETRSPRHAQLRGINAWGYEHNRRAGGDLIEPVPERNDNITILSGDVIEQFHNSSHLKTGMGPHQSFQSAP
jgi:hypothetical protein